MSRWGLRLEFDEDQPLGEHMVALGEGLTVPVNLPGRFVAVRGGRGDSSCRLLADGLAAECRVGRGRAFAIADAALFERPQSPPAELARRAALGSLLARAF